MKETEGRVRKAVTDYGLIEEGDRVAVGVSGGKDSVALLWCLARLREYGQIPFELTAVIADPCFGKEKTDYSPIERLCEELGADCRIRRTDIGKVIFEDRHEHNPCSLCARMRRGILHDMAKECGCGKIALGHHKDDVVETFLLNLLHEGRIGSFAPKAYLSRKDLTMIRPLVLCEEKEIAAAVKRAGLPVVKSRCPEDGFSERQRVKDFITKMEKEEPGFRNKIFGALQRGNISGYGLGSVVADDNR